MLPIADIIRLSWNIYISRFKKFLPFSAVLFGLAFLDGFANSFILDKWNAVFPIKTAVAVSIALIFYLLSFALGIIFIIFSDQAIDNKRNELNFKKQILPVYLAALAATVLGGLLTAAGFILFIIPGLIFTCWYAFTSCVAVLEGKGIFESLRASRTLSRGRFWPVFGRFILPNVFWGVVSYLVTAGILNILGLILNKQLLSEPLSSPAAIATIAVSGLIAAFFSPLYIIATTIAYKEAKK